MNITVFVSPKQVINENWNAVITNMSEADKAGIECALQLKEANGGKVTAVSIGTENADLALREAFAMGVDQAALMDDEEAESAEKIAASLKEVGGDVFISGRQDDEMKKAAELLKVAEIKYTGNEEDISGLNAPAFVFVKAENFEPRHMQVGGVFTAYQRKIERIPAFTMQTL